VIIDDDIFEGNLNGKIGDIFVICDHDKDSFITMDLIKNARV
jgi:hypothetical protein